MLLVYERNNQAVIASGHKKNEKIYKPEHKHTARQLGGLGLQRKIEENGIRSFGTYFIVCEIRIVFIECFCVCV